VCSIIGRKLPPWLSQTQTHAGGGGSGLSACIILRYVPRKVQLDSTAAFDSIYLPTPKLTALPSDKHRTPAGASRWNSANKSGRARIYRAKEKEKAQENSNKNKFWLESWKIICLQLGPRFI
jgi:hypothetical protein